MASLDYNTTMINSIPVWGINTQAVIVPVPIATEVPLIPAITAAAIAAGAPLKSKPKMLWLMAEASMSDLLIGQAGGGLQNYPVPHIPGGVGAHPQGLQVVLSDEPSIGGPSVISAIGGDLHVLVWC